MNRPKWTHNVGQNADWSYEAHHYGVGHPNGNNGDWYIIEGEEEGDPNYWVVQRFRPLDDPGGGETKHVAKFDDYEDAREKVEDLWWERALRDHDDDAVYLYYVDSEYIEVFDSVEDRNAEIRSWGSRPVLSCEIDDADELQRMLGSFRFVVPRIPNQFCEKQYKSYLNWLATSDWSYHLDDAGEDGTGIKSILWETDDLADLDVLKLLAFNHARLMAVIPPERKEEFENFYYALSAKHNF